MERCHKVCLLKRGLTHNVLVEMAGQGIKQDNLIR